MNMGSILERVAQENHTSLAEVRREIDAAIQTGLANTDPAVQAAWRTVPREGVWGRQKSHWEPARNRQSETISMTKQPRLGKNYS